MKDKTKSKKNKADYKQKNDKRKDSGWTIFSDFFEITHIVIKESCVTIYRQDNKTMVILSIQFSLHRVLTWYNLIPAQAFMLNMIQS